MRSARTDHRGKSADRSRIGRGARRASPLLACLFLFLLAACASGDAPDARRGQREEAAAGDNLAVQQATFTAQRYFPPTPTPGPTRTPAATLSSLVLTIGLGAGDEPTDEYAAVPTTAGTAYAGALLHGLQPGQVVSAAWTDAVNTVVATSRFDVTAPIERGWIPLPLYLDGALPPGDYAVHVYVDERPLNSLVFRLSPPGSQPQRLADLPPVDQVRIRSGGPNQTPTSGETEWDPDGQPTDGGQGPVEGQPPLDGQPVDGQPLEEQAPLYEGNQIVPVATQGP